MRNSLLSLLLIFAVTLSASAQTAQPADNGWGRVEALSASTSIRVKGAKRTVVCKFKSADAESLSCVEEGKTDVQVFQLADIKYVKIPHRLRSALIGGAPGAALAGGAGIAAATEKCSNTTFFCGLGADLLAAVGGVLFLIGLGIGAATDFSATTVYKRG
jgi:hypothetical protein